MAGIDPYSRSARAVGIGLRTAHLAAMAVLAGGLHYSLEEPSLRLWLYLTIATGGGLTLSEMSHSRHWVYQGRGLFCIAHVVLAGLGISGLLPGATALALVVGAIGSHVPRTVRKWSLRHRRVLE